MSDRIDPAFVKMIIDAHRAGTLTMDEFKLDGGKVGARVAFKYHHTEMKLVLGEANWAIVKDALAVSKKARN